MLEDKGNTAVYLLYAYTRIVSIARNANITQQQLIQEAKSQTISIQHPKEIKLAKVPAFHHLNIQGVSLNGTPQINS